MLGFAAQSTRRATAVVQIRFVRKRQHCYARARWQLGGQSANLRPTMIEPPAIRRMDDGCKPIYWF